MKLDQENKYFKAENEKNNGHINKLNLEYKQVQDMSNKYKEQDNVIKILKDQLFRQGAITSESGAGGISSPKPSQAGTPVADLEISLVSLTVSQEASQPAPGQNSLAASQDAPQPATQDTSETTLQDATREAQGQEPDNKTEQVEECILNIQCAGNCEHIGCHIKKCTDCGFTTDNQQRLDNHIKEKHRITCFTCKETFKT